MAGLLPQNRAPAEIMQLYLLTDIDRDSRPPAYEGQYKRHPSGSGKYFRKCYGRKKES